MYVTIPCINFLYFLGEGEWRIKLKYLSFEQKLDDFFEMFNLVKIVGEKDLKDDIFK